MATASETSYAIGMRGHTKMVELRDVCTKVTVGLATTVTPFLVPEGVRLIRNQNIRPNRFDDASILYVDTTFAASNSRKKIDKGDVVVVRTGANIGDACVVPDSFAGAQTFTTLIARPNQNVLLPEYLAQFINSRVGRSEVSRLMAGGGKGNLNAGELQRLRLILPELHEQRRIIKILSMWDAGLELIQNVLAAKQRLKNAYATKLLGALHDIPSRLQRADVLFVPVSEKGSPSSELLSVTQDRGVVPRYMLDKRILMDSSDTSNFKLVHKGDFVISLRSFQGGFEFSMFDGIVSPAYTVLRPNQAVVPAYFRHYLKSRDFLRRLAVVVIGIRDGKQINFSDFASVKLPVPAPRDQEKLARFFDALELEIDLLKQQQGELLKQKQGLINRMLARDTFTNTASKKEGL